MYNLTKKVTSFALGTTILLASVSGASAATYTVKSGDTLSAIAKKYNTSYSTIMKKNNLNSTKIRVGQKLTIDEETSTSSTITYSVKNGDTLSDIAKKYGTTYKEIMSMNKLKTTNIKIGQKLKITSKTTSKSSSASTAVSSVPTGTDIANLAKKYVGKPYVYGGSSPKGFDCSGFVYYVFNSSGKSISRTSAAGFYNKAKKVSSPKVGDLVFFSNTYKSGISHVGIYIGSGKMVSATDDKVEIDTLKSGYWKSHFKSYGRI
ncbi:MAG TPA: LysM peptidoglycan-binding domain-containing protein [Niallia sp.]|nr:LysM peptidoglycan-binding domain-containing protein [Niallia sp.]